MLTTYSDSTTDSPLKQTSECIDDTEYVPSNDFIFIFICMDFLPSELEPFKGFSHRENKNL